MIETYCHFVYYKWVSFLHFDWAEYEELLGQSDASSTSSLSTIEERTNWEKQLNDLEEENQEQLRQIDDLERKLEQLYQEQADERQRAREAAEKLSADLEATKVLLTEAIEREEKLIARLEQMRPTPSTSPTKSPPLASPATSPSLRPMSPTLKPGLLPSGYSPLKSKGWAKSQRQSPSKSTDASLDAVDSKKETVNVNEMEEKRRCKSCLVDMLYALTTFSVPFVPAVAISFIRRPCRRVESLSSRHQRVPGIERTAEAARTALSRALRCPATSEATDRTNYARYDRPLLVSFRRKKEREIKGSRMNKTTESRFCLPSCN